MVVQSVIAGQCCRLHSGLVNVGLINSINTVFVCVLTLAPAREDLFAILGTVKPRCMDPPHLAS
jgi:hypothetical protein